ncbi:MAG: alpha,6-mannosyltransferase [Frankiaceae bacterium]|nr:alpha,6-mannosyltransferase [Frankiaceae bacterium]
MRQTDAARWPHRVGPGLLALAAGCLAVTQLLGPSAAEPPLGSNDSGTTPPWHVAGSPSPWLVTSLLVVVVLAGAGVVTLVLTRRWRPDARRLTIAGVLVAGALALLPPIGSADTLSYAAYGRMVTTGHNPYSTTPAQLADGGDRVGAAVEVPWQHTPAVYGPLATAEQAAASAVAGDNPALTVWLLDLVSVAAFILVGLLLLRTGRDPTARLRAATLWTANPLLWFQLVAGAHLETLVAAAVVGALTVTSRSRVAAGALAGAAASVKAPGGLVWLALAWADRASRRALLALAVGAAVVVLPGYAAAGTDAIRQLHRASRLVSLATPWRLLVNGPHLSRGLVGILATVLFIVFVVVLARRLPPGAGAGAVAAVLFLGYVLAAPYELPWYDALAWACLPLMAASWRDGLLLAHTTVLSLAYIPGRAAVHLSGLLQTLTWGMRTRVAPWLLLVVMAAVVVIALRRNQLAGRGNAPEVS